MKENNQFNSIYQIPTKYDKAIATSVANRKDLMDSVKLIGLFSQKRQASQSSQRITAEFAEQEQTQRQMTQMPLVADAGLLAPSKSHFIQFP